MFLVFAGKCVSGSAAPNPVGLPAGRAWSVASLAAEVVPLRVMTRRYVEWVLAQTGGNKVRTAQLLEIDASTIYRMLADMDLIGELPSIRCPVLATGGEFDRGRPPAMVEPIAKAIPGAIFKVLPVGHYAGLQRPDLMAAEIGAFLDSVGA